MTRIHTKILIFFCIVCVLLTTGCFSQNPNLNSSGSNGTNTPVLTVVPTQCPPASGNTTPYIIINPIGNHTVGDVFEINGTTNLGVDSKIVLNLQEQLVSSLPAKYYPLSGTFGCVTIQKNRFGPNSWSYPVNLSGYQPWKYITEIWEESNYTATYNTTRFSVYPNQVQPLPGGEVSR